MSRLTTSCLRLSYAALILMVLAFRSPAAADQDCISDQTIRVCVVSASLTALRVDAFGIYTQASVVLEIVDETDYPIGIAALDQGYNWSFTPKNATTVSGYVEFGGIGECYQTCNSTSATTFAPKIPANVQITIRGTIAPNSLQLAQMASKGTLSGLLIVVSRGESRVVPLSVSEFEFGNGLGQLRTY
ncbi:MAG TPA: hypothetical protein VIM02_05710 [Rhizomicrobium sp.]|jgi:hypothetical protein